ncbi:hypothetical protein BDW69DRAFT_83066 [Aspergillus filifer]
MRLRGFETGSRILISVLALGLAKTAARRDKRALLSLNSKIPSVHSALLSRFSQPLFMLIQALFIDSPSLARSFVVNADGLPHAKQHPKRCP